MLLGYMLQDCMLQGCMLQNYMFCYFMFAGGETAPVTESGDSPENGSPDDLKIQPAISQKLNHVGILLLW